MKRYPSIDFLRGLAIFLMLILHQIQHVLDADAAVAAITTFPLLNLIVLIIIPFLAGLAGLFLLVSAIGNMISMQKSLQNGIPLSRLVIRQVVGGCLVLFFAMLTEGVIGYHGALGNLFKNLDKFPEYLSTQFYDPIFWRFLQFETIHTIAWCIIVNGIVHGVIAAKKKWQTPKKLMYIYGILILIVLILTPFLWEMSNLLYSGFPYAINPTTGKWIMYPYIGISPFKDFVIMFFLNPIAGHPEPIFPYLAVSFLGSIIGIYLSQKKEEISPKFNKNLLRLSVIMFVVGLLGCLINLTLMMMKDFEGTLMFYKDIWDHRAWTVHNGVPFLGWLFQFLMLNGFSLACVCMLLRLVEFRGRAEYFAKNTSFIRRFGYIAFTVYNCQWLYFANFYFFTVAFGDPPYQRYLWGETALIIAAGLALFAFALFIWEKIGYIGSIEWCIFMLNALFLSDQRKAFLTQRTQQGKWYRKFGGLDIEGAFYRAEWLNVIDPEKMNHERLNDSRLAFKLSLVSFIFFPGGFVSLGIARRTLKLEGHNIYLKWALILDGIAIFLACTWLAVLSLVRLADFGISLE